MSDRKKRSVTKCHGVIAPDRLYTREGILRAGGIGSNQLAEARQSGFVTPRYLGRRVYYLGSEVIAWIVETAELQPTNERSS